MLADCMEGVNAERYVKPTTLPGDPATPNAADGAVDDPWSKTDVADDPWTKTDDAFDPWSKTDDANRELALSSPGDEGPLPTPKGMLEDNGIVQLTATMVTTLCPEHISSVGFNFEGSYTSPEPNTKDGIAHKSAKICFTCVNIVPTDDDDNGFVYREIEPASELLAKHLDEKQINVVKFLLDGELEARLVYVHLRVCTEGESDSSCPLYGKAFYSNASFGPFDLSFVKARAMLAGTDTVNLYFFCVASQAVAERIKAVDKSMFA